MRELWASKKDNFFVRRGVFPLDLPFNGWPFIHEVKFKSIKAMMSPSVKKQTPFFLPFYKFTQDILHYLTLC